MKKWTGFLMALILGVLLTAGCSREETVEVADAVNFGPLSIQGDWIYYSNMSAEPPRGQIYKIKTDGTEKTKLTDDSAVALALVGDWIYYSPVTEDENTALYKIKTDGSGKTKVSEDNLLFYVVNDGGSTFFVIDNGWMYYHNAADSFSLYRMKTDDTKRVKLTEGSIPNFMFYDGWIYYGSYKMKPDGTKSERVLEEDTFLSITDGEWIYFEGADRTLQKIKADGSGKEILAEEKIHTIKMDGDWIYYLTEASETNLVDNQMYRIGKDGSEKVLLSEDDCYFMDILDGRIYYLSISDTGFQLNSMNTDGTDKITYEGFEPLVFVNW